MRPRLPDPNALWTTFVTNPAGSLSTAELKRESAACAQWLSFLNGEQETLGDSRWIKAFGTLGWVGTAISLPAIFAQPQVGFAVWCFSAAAAYGAHRAARSSRRKLEQIGLLVGIFLSRQREVVDELSRRP